MQTHALFTILGDPMRFRIVEILAEGEKAVGDLVDRLDIHQSGVSRHLAMLLENGIVEVRRDGQYRRYSLRPQPFQHIENWAAECRSLWFERLDRLEGALTDKLKFNSTQPKKAGK